MKWIVCLLLPMAAAVCAEQVAEPNTVYVSKNEPKPLQLIVDAANPGDEIVVAPGVYNMGGRQVDQDGPATRLVVDKPLTIRSEAGANQTFLMGGPSTRCLYLTNGAEVIGFTISGGETCRVGPEGNKFKDLSGGGVWSEPGGTITDCMVVSNTALWYGGGMYGGTAMRCTFKENTARRSGGAASHARLGDCLLAYNRAGRFGGGAQRSELFNCTVAQNRAEIMGGGTSFGAAVNSIIQHNQALQTHHNYYSTEMTFSSSWPKPDGEGNIDGDPGFLNTDTGVFSLHYASPAIDHGTDTFLVADINGRPRVLDGNNNGHARVDMGAFEFAYPKADRPGDGTPDSAERAFE
ncbi:choice-of-anchor Q domain-containing protein [Tichowtungia aerotolerans]|uniref:Right handed beta helix domain-containing protein n=1 Tax=Tichowtungia aerotolerans TaxID=2697043 RepID=A0A6P1M6S5_9BACT|nr:choice-of-anchor Q domain-containing protein [Tichowtungia aerotolerans]QHI68294.1 hypothetical protein GT409_02090 [Tichowtungia aerotolerans]